ncbi:MAG TPA: prolyl oligopeptidase family serine peptidase [Vicinamibacterales bacterium]|nr:prolyl oligopeptidase family serine peptidase [Vicinamibacterales bacterium]
MTRILRCGHGAVVAFSLTLFLWPTTAAARQSMAQDRYVLPPESVQELFRRDKNLAKLDRLSPDGDHFVIPQFQELTDLKLMSQRTLRLAMLELVPEVNREWRLATYGNTGLNFYSLKERRTYPVKLPPNAFVSDMRWSPDGLQLAFIAHLPTMSQVWTANVRTGEARAVSEAPVMATLVARPGGGGEAADTQGGRMLQWLPDGSLLTVIVPGDRGPEPPVPVVPTAPIIRHSRDKETPTSTQPFLLRTAHDEQLFKHYTTAQLAIVAPGRLPRLVGRPAMYLDYWLSPDGRHILRETLDEPLSYLVGFNSFGRRLEVIDLDGRVLAEIRRRPLQEAQTRGNDPAADDAPRDVVWRPDGAGLSLVWREPATGRGDANAPGDRKDRLMLLAPPFALDRAQTLISTEHRISNVRYARDGRQVFMTLGKRATGSARREDLVAYDLAASQPAAFVLKANIDPEDPVMLPGDILTGADANGVAFARVSSDGSSIFLEGAGYRANFRPQPFIDRVAFRSGETSRVFEGAPTSFDEPLVPLDPDITRLIVQRQGKSTHPDSYLWTRASAQFENLTNNKDPYPEITRAQRVDFDFVRRDGVTVQARISLPTNYQPGTRVPAIFWTYPREFEDDKAYQRGALRARNHNAYSPLSFLRWSDIWLTQGYALVYPDIPILGKNGTFNDHFRPHLVDTIYAAIRKVDELGYVDINRIGHGGHSYGAFTTANLLAHTPFFKAGIAGDGAYNRTLTPLTFQGERRNFWEAQQTYVELSPFFYADQINAPLLMYHGAQDNNSGTFIIQSERMMQALTGLGKKAALYIYPFESHAPRARENFLDLWARWIDWFDTYVKNAPPKATTTQ